MAGDGLTMMIVGDDDHCADAVAGSAKTAAANNAGRTTLVISMTLSSNHTSPMITSWCACAVARKLTE